MSKSEGQGRTPVIRDEGFARRLETACEANPNCPTEQYRGKQKWVYDNLLEKFDIKVSPEAVRRWFAGEMRPRLKTMSALAQLLEVDLGWLTLGTKPEMTPKERKARNAVADGAVNLVAGIVQMNGGSVAFPTDGNHGPDLYAIIGGKQYVVEVKLAFQMGPDTVRFTVADDTSNQVVIGVIKDDKGFGFSLLNLTPEVVSGAPVRGDFREVIVQRRGSTFHVGEKRVPRITSLKDIDATNRYLA